ncbi:hypothetical protein ACS15_4766 [Ralstonia insidiosa]|uniref:Uncharacterized protein n=1 Tax=Ralstonia insidiosa TaxID=190721 RepID=A0AAC9BJY7_9RALS|nr:hypothetical protein ACS15_4766 [Ralstonia insidiosa]
MRWLPPTPHGGMSRYSASIKAGLPDGRQNQVKVRMTQTLTIQTLLMC